MKVCKVKLNHIMIKPRHGTKNYEGQIKGFLGNAVSFIQKIYPKLQVVGIGEMTFSIPIPKRKGKVKGK